MSELEAAIKVVEKHRDDAISAKRVHGIGSSAWHLWHGRVEVYEVVLAALRTAPAEPQPPGGGAYDHLGNEIIRKTDLWLAEKQRAERAEADNAALLQKIHNALNPFSDSLAVREMFKVAIAAEHPGSALLAELAALRTQLAEKEGECASLKAGATVVSQILAHPHVMTAIEERLRTETGGTWNPSVEPGKGV